MDEQIKEKTETMIDNICAIAGTLLLGIPLMRQATKEILPEIEKLVSLDSVDIPKMLTDGKEKDYTKNNHEKSQYDEKDKDDLSEIEILRKKLAEYEKKDTQDKI